MSSKSTGPASPATETCANLPQSDLLPMELPLTLSAAVSPAKTLAQPEKGQGFPVNGRDYGVKSPVLLANYDPDTSSWRTSQHCLVEGLEQFSETWPRSGMMRSGTAYQLPTLAHLTDATGFGLSLTHKPTHSVPTPTASDHIERKSTSKETLNFETNKSVSLDRWVKMWPTPTARDHKGGRKPETLEASGRGASNSLNDALTVSGQHGQLNPTWVEWLMGFPIGHTDLKG